MKRKIAVLIGSDSDLPQCEHGLNYLRQKELGGGAEVLGVYTASIHRNTGDVLRFLQVLSERGDVDAIIAGAGWANHLTGTADAFLRYTLKDQRIVVIGVAFLDGDKVMHNTAAMLSISEVPGTQVVFGPYNGSSGFLNACMFAVEEELPKITLKEGRLAVTRTLNEALAEIYGVSPKFIENTEPGALIRQ